MGNTTGAVTEHWMDKRIRLHKPINDPTNLIRISAVDIARLIEHKNRLLGTNKTIRDESDYFEERRKVSEL